MQFCGGLAVQSWHHRYIFRGSFGDFLFLCVEALGIDISSDHKINKFCMGVVVFCSEFAR